MTSDSRRISVFFYGLFMDAEALRAKGLEPVNVRSCSIRGWELRLGKRAALAANPRSSCHGMVMELTHGEAHRLYAEPSVSMYRPEAVQAQLADGSTIAALCYNLPVAPDPEEVNPVYADQLRSLAHKLGLPEDYIRRIR
jgi:hypothetical protein